MALSMTAHPIPAKIDRSGLHKACMLSGCRKADLDAELAFQTGNQELREAMECVGGNWAASGGCFLVLGFTAHS